jgi:hypothetical protein
MTLSPQEILRQHGITLTDTKPGRYYTTCPRCSKDRRKKNDKCLGVTLDAEGVRFGCNHCGWTGPEKGPGNGHDLTAYDYVDAAGKLLFQKVRNPPGREPRFWCRRPNGTYDGWINDTKGINNKPLYRWPGIIKAMKEDREIAIVEGEKDADNLWRLGIPATCNFDGAADVIKHPKAQPKWKAAYSEALRGARIVVFNDNDPPGYAHADTVCKLSLGIAKRVRRLDLKNHWPEIPQKADVSDWLARGHSRDELVALIEQTPDWTDRPVESGEPPRFKLKHCKEVLMSTVRNYLIKGLLPRRGLAVIWGPPKCGKSFIAFDMAMHIALDRDYRGHRVQQGTAVYLAPEGGGGFPARVEAWRQRFLAEDAATDEIPFWLLNDARIDLIADQAELVAAIRTQIEQPPAVIFVDTLNRSLVGDENSSADMGKYVRAADELASAFDCLVVLIHHCGIAGGRPRGHSSLSGADDVEISVAKDTAGLITVTVDLMKDGPVAEPFGCRLEQVTAGIDDDGDSITSCVVVAIDLPPGAGKGAGIRLTDNQRRFLDIMRSALRDGMASSDGINITRNELKKYCLSKGWIEEDDNKGRAKLSEMINNLAGKKVVGASKNMVWVLTAQA